MIETLRGHLARLVFRREVLYLIRALAEACMLTPWLALVILSYRPLPIHSITTLGFVVILGASYLTRALNATAIQAQRQRAIAASAILAMSAAVLYSLGLIPHEWPTWHWLTSALRALIDLANIMPPGLTIVLLVAFLSWRGLRLAQKQFSVRDVALGFQVGVLLFAIFMVFSIAAPDIQSEINPSIVAFFFCQLLAIGLTRVETLGHRPGGRPLPFGNWWLALLTLSTAGVIGIALLIIGIALGIGPEYITQGLVSIIAIVLIPLSLIATPFLAAFGMLFEWLLGQIHLEDFASLLQTLLARLEGLATEPLPNDPTAQRSPLVDVAVRVAGASKGILTIAIVAAVLIGVIWAINRLQTQRNPDSREKHESIWSGREWLARLRQRFQNIGQAARQLVRLGAGGFLTALTIRRIYARLQKLAAQRGYPRALAWTPYEYLPILNKCFPGYEAELTHITESYVGIHYGELPETAGELQEIRAAWERIRANAQ